MGSPSAKRVRCPNDQCREVLGGPATDREGLTRIRSAIILFDQERGEIQAVCPECKQPFTVASQVKELNPAIVFPQVQPRIGFPAGK